MIVKTHAGREPLQLMRLRFSRDLRRERWMMNKRQNKVTRVGFMYDVLLTYNDNHKRRERVTISKRNDKAIIDGLLRDPRIKRVEIRGLTRCIFAMEPDNYYAQAQILTMESVIID